ncbi:MAG: hypothetical protein HY393_01290 [Candidatus Diapherotrites archaeon]|nr:hypothetical protein [Candidatus Diapherotrites archaeon]
MARNGLMKGLRVFKRIRACTRGIASKGGRRPSETCSLYVAIQRIVHGLKIGR